MNAPAALPRPRGRAPTLRFALRDLRGGLAGLRIFLLCIALGVAAQRIELQVSDDGKGFAPAKINVYGLGLHAMKYRADVVGAELRIESQAGKGTRIICSLPQKA